MIVHKIEDKSETWVKEEKIPISKKEVQRIRALLNIESFEEWDDAKREKLGIKPDTSEYIFGIQFSDGATLDWKLCCGQSNYYDDVLFQYPNGVWTDLDCSYELDDLEIDTGSTVYIARLDIQDE